MALGFVLFTHSPSVFLSLKWAQHPNVVGLLGSLFKMDVQAYDKQLYNMLPSYSSASLESTRLKPPPWPSVSPFTVIPAEIQPLHTASY